MSLLLLQHILHKQPVEGTPASVLRAACDLKAEVHQLISVSIMLTFQWDVSTTLVLCSAVAAPLLSRNCCLCLSSLTMTVPGTPP